MHGVRIVAHAVQGFPAGRTNNLRTRADNTRRYPQTRLITHFRIGRGRGRGGRSRGCGRGHVCGRGWGSQPGSFNITTLENAFPREGLLATCNITILDTTLDTTLNNSTLRIADVHNMFGPNPPHGKSLRYNALELGVGKFWEVGSGGGGGRGRRDRNHFLAHILLHTFK